jgi:predicted ATPase
VREAVALAAAERPDLVVLRGRCPAVGSAVTYRPFAEVVRGAAGIALDDSRQEAEQKLRQRAGDLLAQAGVSAPDAEATIFALATTAGIALADNPLDRSRPLAVATELARRWPQFLSAAATQGQVVVVIEDLHWASEQVVEMVDRLQARCVGPILLLATARPEFAESRPSFAAGRSESIALRPLERSESERLLDGLLPGHDLPVSLLEQIVATADGNPLFVEEIVTV